MKQNNKERNDGAESAQLIGRIEAARQLNVGLTTLGRWRVEGYLVPVKAGKRTMYRKADIDALTIK